MSLLYFVNVQVKRISYTNGKDDKPTTVCFGRSFSDSVVDIKLTTTVRQTREKANKTGSNRNADIHAVLARMQCLEPKGKLPAEKNRQPDITVQASTWTKLMLSITKPYF
jgi:hypothetical protein